MNRAISIAFALGLVGCGSYLERSRSEPLVVAPEDYSESYDAPPERSAERRERTPAERDTPSSAQPAIEVPESYEASFAVSPSSWGTALGAPALDPLLVEVIRANYDVGAAIARVEQSTAMARQVRAARLPQINGQISGNYGSFVRPPFGRTTQWEVAFSLPVSYEIDLFGRYANDHAAARLDARAAQRDADAIAISVASQASESYFDLVEIRARQGLLEAQLETNQTFLELVTLRFERGLTSVVDVHQQQQLVAGTEAQLAVIDGQESVVENQIAILLGAMPDRTFASVDSQLPDLPPVPERGVPSEVLDRRPDIEAAFLRLRAADARVASAIRAQLPSIIVSFTPGYNFARTQFPGAEGALFPQDVIRGFAWQVGGTLNVPIFDGLRGPAISAQRRAQVEELLATYKQAVVGALVEVENAIALERQQRMNIAQLERQLEFANQTLEAAQTRYRSGLSDFLPVLTALRTQQEGQLALLAARRQLVSQRLQLYRALGAAVRGRNQGGAP